MVGGAKASGTAPSVILPRQNATFPVNGAGEEKGVPIGRWKVLIGHL
jgi:hypothetical protein